MGAAVPALAAGVVRDGFGSYTYAWWGGAALCAIAAVLSITVTRPATPSAEVGEDRPQPSPH